MVGVPGKYKGMSSQTIHANLSHLTKSTEVAIRAGLVESSAIILGRSAKSVSTMAANVVGMNEKLSSSLVHRTIEAELDPTHHEMPSSRELPSLKLALRTSQDSNS